MLFVELSQQRYDVILMNPPFGDPVPKTKDYIEAAYDKSAGDIYAAFVQRGLELLNEHGYLGAITSRTGFFLTSFEGWRSQLVLPRTVALIDLGIGVMHDAMVEAAAYVLAARPHHGQASFRRLLDKTDKASEVYHRANRPLPSSSRSDLRISLAHQQPTGFRLNFSISSKTTCRSKAGPERCEWAFKHQTTSGSCGSGGKFLSEEIGRGKRWVPFAKGGEYSPYYADLHLVVEWEEDGRRIRSFARSRGESESRTIRSESQYFRAGLTWSLRSQKGFSVRPDTRREHIRTQRAHDLCPFRRAREPRPPNGVSE